MRSGKLAQLAGVSADTLRHYERLGLLPSPQRSAGGYRLYPPSALDRVRMIRRALAIGFSLKELGRILRVREQGGAPCREVRAMADQKLRELEDRIEEMTALQRLLNGLLAQWDKKLSHTPKGSKAFLLEGLSKL
jgi:DNA-binding transcriptional MerR regulator